MNSAILTTIDAAIDVAIDAGQEEYRRLVNDFYGIINENWTGVTIDRVTE